jgi:mono/diheme cytochrome c family protein
MSLPGAADGRAAACLWLYARCCCSAWLEERRRARHPPRVFGIYGPLWWGGMALTALVPQLLWLRRVRRHAASPSRSAWRRRRASGSTASPSSRRLLRDHLPRLGPGLCAERAGMGPAARHGGALRAGHAALRALRPVVSMYETRHEESEEERRDAATLTGVMGEFDERRCDGRGAARARARRAGGRWTPSPPTPCRRRRRCSARAASASLSIAIGAGLFGAALAYGTQWYLSVHEYPINVGGRPLHAWPAFLPATTIVAILWAAAASLLGMLALNRLPRLSHPVFAAPGFLRASEDRFFLLLSAADPRFGAEEATRLLERAGALRVGRGAGAMRWLMVLLPLLAACDGWPESPRPDPPLPAPPGSVARGEPALRAALAPPGPAVDDALLARGADRYAISCTPCHGTRGAGDGPVVARGFPRPPGIAGADAGRSVEVMGSNHAGAHPFDDRIAPHDRWAIARFVEQLPGEAASR